MYGNQIPKYKRIIIADSETGNCKRLRFEQLTKLNQEDLLFFNGIVGCSYDIHHDILTFVEVDPDDWEKYHDCYESADNAPNPALNATKFYGGFSFFGLDLDIKVIYGSDTFDGMDVCVFNKSGGKDFVRLEKGFVVYNDELYIRKTNEVAEIFWVDDTTYTHSIMYYTGSEPIEIHTHPSIGGITSIADLAFACKYRHSMGNAIESYFLINDEEYKDALFNTKFGWYVFAQNNEYENIPHEIATLQYKSKSYAVLEKHNGFSTYINIQDADGEGEDIFFQDSRIAITTPIPIIITHGSTIIKLVHEGAYFAQCKDNKLYFGHPDLKYCYMVLELEIVGNGYAVVRCVPRFKQTSEGVYDLREDRIVNNVDLNEQSKALGFDILGSFNMEDYKAYIKSQSAYIRREGLKCKLASNDANVWLLREVNSLPATDLYFKITPHEEGFGITLWVSKDGKNYTDTMKYNVFSDDGITVSEKGKSYLALRSSKYDGINAGIAFVEDNAFFFFKLENIFDMIDSSNEDNEGNIDTYEILGNNDILKELDNGYIRGNLLQRV